jgi:hypothetical protein
LIRRRVFLIVLLSLPSGVFSENALELTPSLSAAEMQTALQHAVQGQPMDQVISILTTLGARDLVVTDLAAMGLPVGTVVAEGLIAGDAVALVTFGLRRGFLSADRRVQATLPYDANRVVTAVSDVTLIAK